MQVQVFMTAQGVHLFSSATQSTEDVIVHCMSKETFWNLLGSHLPNPDQAYWAQTGSKIDRPLTMVTIDLPLELWSSSLMMTNPHETDHASPRKMLRSGAMDAGTWDTAGLTFTVLESRTENPRLVAKGVYDLVQHITWYSYESIYVSSATMHDRLSHLDPTETIKDILDITHHKEFMPWLMLNPTLSVRVTQLLTKLEQIAHIAKVKGLAITEVQPTTPTGPTRRGFSLNLIHDHLVTLGSAPQDARDFSVGMAQFGMSTGNELHQDMVAAVLQLLERKVKGVPKEPVPCQKFDTLIQSMDKDEQ